MQEVDLPVHVREFVAGLNESDIDTLKNLMRLFRDMQGLCRFTRWVIWAGFAAAFVIWQGTDGIRHMLGLVPPKVGP